MRKALFAMILAAPLAACQTVGAPGNDPVAQVQTAATQICAYLPTAATVAALLSTAAGIDIPFGSNVTKIATDICAVVTKSSARRGGARKLRGVTIRGRFVR